MLLQIISATTSNLNNIYTKTARQRSYTTDGTPTRQEEVGGGIVPGQIQKAKDGDPR